MPLDPQGLAEECYREEECLEYPLSFCIDAAVHILTGCVNMASHCIIHIFFLPVSSTPPERNAGLSLICQQLLALLCEGSR